MVISARLAVVVAFVILLPVLLMAAFRSVVIPLVSAVLTLLSTGAYGVVVAVFQWGWLGGRAPPINMIQVHEVRYARHAPRS